MDEHTARNKSPQFLLDVLAWPQNKDLKVLFDLAIEHRWPRHQFLVRLTFEQRKRWDALVRFIDLHIKDVHHLWFEAWEQAQADRVKERAG